MSPEPYSNFIQHFKKSFVFREKTKFILYNNFILYICNIIKHLNILI